MSRRAHGRQVVWQEYGLRSLPFIILVTLLMVWQGSYLVFNIPQYYASPGQIVTQIVSMGGTSSLYVNSLLSLKRVVFGFLIGGGLGLFCGLVAGSIPAIRDILNPAQAFIHAVPKIAIFPALAAVLGFTDEARITIIAIGAFFPVYLNALSGVTGTNRQWLWVARNNGASRLRTYCQVIAPAALPRSLVGIRIALNVSFVMMVATEVVGFADGLGASVLSDYYNGLYPAMYANVILIALFGITGNIVLRRLSIILLKGRPSWVVGKR